MGGIGITSATYGAMRFAVSPVWEVVTSRWVLLHPAKNPALAPWLPLLQDANRHLADAHREVLDALIRDRAWMPDFITPVLPAPAPTIEAELAVVRTTDPERARHDLLATEARSPLPPLARRMADEPTAWVPRIADALEAWWTAAVEPLWPRFRAVLEADIAYRAGVLAAQGPRSVLASLHPTLQVGDDSFTIVGAHWLDPLVGREANGLLLVPSMVLVGKPVTNILPDNPTVVVYGVRAPGTAWERTASPHRAALDAVLGATRARLLELAVAPHTTTRLAQRSGLSVPAVSMQMAALADAGLVSRRREGRQVWHVVTDVGRTLLAANGVRVD